MTKWCLLGAQVGLLALFGCQQTVPLPEVRIVKVPVPVPCVDKADLPASPKIANNQELNALTDFDLVLQLQVERLDLLRYSTEQNALLQACVKP